MAVRRRLASNLLWVASTFCLGPWPAPEDVVVDLLQIATERLFIAEVVIGVFDVPANGYRTFPQHLIKLSLDSVDPF